MPRETGEAATHGMNGLASVGRILCAALLAVPTAAAAQAARVQVSFDREEMAADETATLVVRIDAPETPDSIEWPKGAPFEVLSRSESRQSSFSMGGGAGVQMRQTVVYQLTVQPRKAGALEFPPLVVTVRGNKVSSEPARIRVLPAGARPRPQVPQQQPGLPGFPPGFGPGPRVGGGTWRGWEKDLRLEVELDRKEAWVGQQVTATFWLLSPVGVVATEGQAPPAYDGFWTEEIERPQTLDSTVRTVDGIPLRAYLLQRMALFPTRAGDVELGSYEIKVAVRVGTDSPFDPFPEVRSARRKSEPVTISVKPLPPGAPRGFESVNVGSLKLEASTSETAVPAGQPVTVKVVARGEANVRALSMPRLPDIPGVRRFEPTATDQVSPKGGRLSGARTLETVLVPEKAGDLVVPALSWPVFDPATGKYEVLRTSALTVKVLPGAPVAAAPVAGTNALTAGLRPIRAEGGLRPVAPPPWRGPLYLAVLGLPVVGWMGAAVALRVRERSAAPAGARRPRAAGRMARRRLGAARRLLVRGERERFLAEVERALGGFAADRLGAQVAGLTRDELAAALVRAGATPPAVKAFASALEACDAARYGRGATDPHALLAEAERALALLDQSDWARGRAA